MRFLIGCGRCFFLSLLLCCGLASVAASVSIFKTHGQSSAKVEVRGDSWPDLLAAAKQRVLEYKQIFRDLMATETRATELFKRDGKSDGKQSALSDIIVYQSRVDEKTIHECRLTNAVNGKPVAKREKEIQTQ